MKGQDMLIRGLLNEGSAAVAWAGSPGARAQYSAAMSVARQLGSAVTGTELSAMLWAAHNARPIADGRTRVVRELKISPEGEDDGTLPRTFRLDAWDYPEKMFQGSWTRNGTGTRTILAEDINRAGIVELIEELAGWLAWNGDNG